MFSQIATPSSQALENRDVLMARKPGTLKIAREPLADRAVNPSLSKAKAQTEQAKPQLELAKPRLAPSEGKSQITDTPDWYGDICSFKDIQLKDTFDDIWPKSQRLSSTDFLNTLKPPKTPPLAFSFDDDLLPMLVELPTKLSIGDFSNMMEEVPIDSVEFPDFDLSF